MNDQTEPLHSGPDEGIPADFTPCGQRMDTPFGTYVCDRPAGHDDTLGHRDHRTYFFVGGRS